MIGFDNKLAGAVFAAHLYFAAAELAVGALSDECETTLSARMVPVYTSCERHRSADRARCSFVFASSGPRLNKWSKAAAAAAAKLLCRHIDFARDHALCAVQTGHKWLPNGHCILDSNGAHGRKVDRKSSYEDPEGRKG